MYKVRYEKRIISVVVITMLLISLIVIPQVSVSAANYNYGESLQKAIMFYEFQRSGKLPADTRNNWRGDSALQDGSDANLDLTGGWYDAGDMVKFNLPMAYSVSMLSWSVYESRDAYVKSGQLSYILDNIKWATDYLIKCHPSANVYYYQVGDSSVDHAWWGPAEVMPMKRPSYKLDSSNPGSAVSGEAAAALAAASIIFKDTDPSYSSTCLKHSKELYTFADTTRSDKGYTAAAGCYASGGFYDELTWAATWLYMATNDSTYLAKAEAYEPNWERIIGSTEINYKWVQCWDNKLYGSWLLLARITNKQIYKDIIEKNLDYWTTGVGDSKIKYTPKGLAWLDMWGSLRYATTEAFIASVYADWSGCTQSKAAGYKSFAKSQVDYALGSTGKSYEVGFGTGYPKHPHHRTAHGSYIGYLSGNQVVPTYHRHVLVGALVGGPGSSDDYTDDINNYTNNEVACDYNAGFVAALSKLYGQYGGTTIADLNAIETPVDDEFAVNISANSYGSKNNVGVDLTLSNMTAWPARIIDNLTCRYFVNLSEVISAGYKASDVTCAVSKASPVTVSSLMPWDTSKNIYYVDVDFSGAKLAPNGINNYQKTVSFKISLPSGVDAWDNTNDFSYDGTASSDWRGVTTMNIPVYENGKKVFGNEPPGSGVSTTPTNKPTPTSPSPTPTPSGTTGATISGYIVPDFSFTSGMSSSVLSGFKVELGQSSVLTGSDGYFEFKNLEENNSYTVKISKNGYLAEQIGGIIAGGPTANCSIWYGDINADGAINMSDIMEFAKYFNVASTSPSYNALLDPNKDNAINMTDIMIAVKHFNKTAADYPIMPPS